VAEMDQLVAFNKSGLAPTRSRKRPSTPNIMPESQDRRNCSDELRNASSWHFGLW
jgi:hypothetical protein